MWDEKAASVGPAQYEVLETLGHSGMGQVHLAIDLKLHRKVVIKTIPEECDPEEYEQYILDEALAIASLSHPNIVTVYNLGRNDHGLFFVMEYLKGGTLAQHIEKNGALSVQAVVGAGIAIAEGLFYAHKKSIWHRDIKPENIMFDQDGWIKLVDFGISKNLNRSKDRFSDASGTRYYVSPEQFKAVGTADHRTDIYAFGKTLLFMLLAKKLSAEEAARALDEFSEYFPPGLKTLVLAMCDETPAKRPYSMAEVIEELEKIKAVLPQVKGLPLQSRKKTKVILSRSLIFFFLATGIATLTLYRLGTNPVGEEASGFGSGAVQTVPGRHGEVGNTIGMVETKAIHPRKATSSRNSRRKLSLGETELPSKLASFKKNTRQLENLLDNFEYFKALGLMQEIAKTHPSKDLAIRIGTLKDILKTGLENAIMMPKHCFAMGRDGSDFDEKPEHRVCLRSYYLDRHEITVEEYRNCVTAGVCDPPEKFSSYCNWELPNRRAHPVNCVSWPKAQRYCRWRGGRLPTEAEWESAATTQGKGIYPWPGEDRSCLRAVWQNIEEQCIPGGTDKVCSRSKRDHNAFCDLIGNVMEWMEDTYRADAYSSSPEESPLYWEDSESKVIRGGSWQSSSLDVDGKTRFSYGPALVSDALGFRCAFDVHEILLE